MGKADSKKIFLNFIAQAIFDKNGCNIFALDIRNVTDFTDYLIIAEGNVNRHVVAIAKKIIEEAEKIGEKPIHVDGLTTGEWVVIDFVDLVVHLFVPEFRQRYNLEELWGDGEIVDLNIVLPNKRCEDE